LRNNGFNNAGKREKDGTNHTTGGDRMNRYKIVYKNREDQFISTEFFADCITDLIPQLTNLERKNKIVEVKNMMYAQRNE
jgi:Ran GTPase-activating protein (RanGAP) involved in mRNA processing and transport